MARGCGIGLGLSGTYIEPPIPGGPQDMASVYAWYDFADTSTITHASGAVSQVDDKGPNGKDVTQSTAAAKPLTGTYKINNRNVLYFDGGDVLRSLTYDITLMNTDVYFFIVFEPDSQATKRLCGYPGYNHHMDTNGYANFFADAWVLDAGTAATAAVHTHCVKISDTASEFWRDGVSLDTSAYGSVADVTPTQFDIGQSAGAAFVGKIAELVIFTDGSERAALQTYAQTRWGAP